MILRKRKGQVPLELPAVPWVFVGMLFFIVLFVILVYFAILTSSYFDKSATVSYAFHTFLNSNVCASGTKIPLKDVIATGIAQKKYSAIDIISLQYGDKKEGLSISNCLTAFNQNKAFGEYYRFVVYSSECPSDGCYIYDTRALGGAVTKSAYLLNIESSEYVALPNGKIVKIVLNTR